MSKRIIRIAGNKLFAELEKLRFIQLHIVLNNGTTRLGRLINFSENQMTLEDAREHSHIVELGDIYEVIYDATQRTALA
jgi:hypothetical protein